MVNSTFRGAEPSWANACVGENGQPDYVDYAKGFSAAANLLISRVIDDNGIHHYVDELIYPICFNMRHSVELRLKGAIKEISQLANLLGKGFTFSLSSSHDIGIIWKFFSENSESLDKRYAAINSKIDTTITDIAEIDPTGQVFRYPESNDCIKHLVDVSIINIVVLRDKFLELEDNLNELHRLSVWLNREYRLSTFTSKLSRPMLYQIAKMLPHKSTWAEIDFATIKEKIKNQFSLSSNDFNRAICKIKSQHTLSAMIGELIPLSGVTEEYLFTFFDEWFKSHQDLLSSNHEETKSVLIHLATPSLLDEIMDDINKDEMAFKALANTLSIEKLAGLKALFYFARDREFVEFYRTIYENYLNEYSHYQDQGAVALKDAFLHLFRKSNAIHNILQSLYILGYVDIAEALVARYKLESAFSWLEKARRGELYKYPKFSEY